MRTVTFVLIAVLFASLAAAQPVSLGKLEVSADTTIDPGAGIAPYSFIDIAHPAHINGTVTNASIYWSASVVGGTCAAAYTLYFLHPVPSPSPFSYSVIAKRGPFDAIGGRNDVTLSPGVDVQAGDVMGITLNKPHSGCGTVWQRAVSPSAAPQIQTSTDLANGLGNFSMHVGTALNIVATTNPATTVQVIPAAGSTAGSFGAFFRTSVQLLNSSPSNIACKLIFHPQGQVGSSSDPSQAFNLAPGQVVSYSDLVTQMGQSGVGSVDVVTTGSAPLNISARVFNDNGAAGTNGFYEEPVTMDDALQQFATGSFILPADSANFRTNIGIRSLAGGATITATLMVSGSAFPVAQVNNKVYPADEFVQQSLTSFFNIVSVPPGAYIRAQVTQGSAIVYASVTDNRTNDTAVHYLQP